MIKKFLNSPSDSLLLKQIVSALSHDIRAPVRHAAHFVEFFEENQNETHEYSSDSHLEHAKASLTEAAQKIEQLVRFARLELDDTSNKRTSVKHLFREAHAISKTAFDRHNAVLSTKGDADIHCNRSLMLEAFAHLTDNAVIYSAKEHTAELAITMINQALTVDIIVEDNGSPFGINPAILLRLFQKGVHPSEQENRLGFGLSFAERVFQLHGGTIELFEEASAMGGAKLKITLPRAI